MSLRAALADDAAIVRQSARVARVAELLGCDESAVRRMVADGTIEAHRIGVRGIRVYLDSVKSYQDGRAVATKGSNLRLKAQRSAVSMASNASAEAALRKSGILR